MWLKAEAMAVFQLYDDFGNGCPGIDAYGLGPLGVEHVLERTLGAGPGRFGHRR